MSKEPSTSRFVARNVSKNTHPKSNENKFETSLNSIHFPPSRTPLNMIQDPPQSQSQKDFHNSDFDSHHKLEVIRSTRALDKKLEASDRARNVSHSYFQGFGSGRNEVTVLGLCLLLLCLVDKEDLLAGFVSVFLFLLEISLCFCFCVWLTRKGKKMLENLGMCSYVDLQFNFLFSFSGFVIFGF